MNKHVYHYSSQISHIFLELSMLLHVYAELRNGEQRVCGIKRKWKWRTSWFYLYTGLLLTKQNNQRKSCFKSFHILFIQLITSFDIDGFLNANGLYNNGFCICSDHRAPVNNLYLKIYKNTGKPNIYGAQLLDEIIIFNTKCLVGSD